MAKPDLSRYARAQDGVVIIDVTTSAVRDLYNNFDRHAPYIRRDLDPELTDYLVECAEEIGSAPFLIQIRLDQPPTPEQEQRVRESLWNYFSYLGRLERRSRRRARGVSMALMALGAVLLLVVLSLEQWPAFHNNLACSVLNQGLTVAAWVALWEALATYFVRWWPYRWRQRVYGYLAHAPVRLISAPNAEEYVE